METPRSSEAVSAPAESMEGLEVNDMAVHYPNLRTIDPLPADSDAEDVLAEFDVEDSEKAFLRDPLKTAPREEVEQLELLRRAEVVAQDAALRREVREDLGTVKYPATLARLREHVRAYADAHALASRIGRLERRAYRRDMYDFGRAIGLSRQEARRERARYRIEMGRVVDDSDESDLEDAFDVDEGDDQTARVQPLDSEFDAELRRLMGKCVGIKRKRDDGEEESQSKLAAEHRKERRAAKKARKAANTQERISVPDSKVAAPVAPKTPQKIEQDAQKASKLSESAKKTRKAAKKARKAAELTARNFNQKSAPAENKKEALAKSKSKVPLVDQKHPETAADKSEKLKRKRERKKAKKAAEGSATSGSSKQTVTVPTTINGSKAAEKKTPKAPSKEQEKKQQDQTIPESASTDAPKESKRTRKRKRNNNLLKETDAMQPTADIKVEQIDATEPATEAEARKNYAASNKEIKGVTNPAGPKPDKKQKLSAMEVVVEQMKEEAKLNQAKALELAKVKGDVDMGGMDAQDAELDLQAKVEDKIDQKQIETIVQDALLEDQEAAKERGTFDAQSGKTVPQMMEEEREAAILEENGAAKPLDGFEGYKKRRSRGKGRKSVGAAAKDTQEDQEMADLIEPEARAPEDVSEKTSPDVEEPASKDQDAVMEDAPEANAETESQNSRRRRSRGKGRKSGASMAENVKVEQQAEAGSENTLASCSDIPIEPVKVEPIDSAQPAEISQAATDIVTSVQVSTSEDQAVENAMGATDHASAISSDDAYLADTNTPKSTRRSRSKHRKSNVSAPRATMDAEELSNQDNGVSLKKEPAEESCEKSSGINDVQIQPSTEDATAEAVTEPANEMKTARRTRAKARKSRDAKEALKSPQEDSPVTNAEANQEGHAAEEKPTETSAAKEPETAKTPARATRRKAPTKATAAPEAKETLEESASDNIAVPVKALKTKALIELRGAEANISSPVRRSTRRALKSPEEQSKENHS